MWLCGGDDLLTYAGTHGVRSRGAPGHPVNGASDGPGISSISSSCMVKDEATGLTYVDTITTSIGRTVISGDATLLNPNAPGPAIEDITDRD